MATEDAIGGEVAQVRSLRETNASIGKFLEVSRNDIRGVSIGNDIAPERSTKLRGVVDEVFSIVMAFFFSDSYGIAQGKGGERLSHIYICAVSYPSSRNNRVGEEVYGKLAVVGHALD